MASIVITKSQMLGKLQFVSSKRCLKIKFLSTKIQFYQMEVIKIDAECFKLIIINNNIIFDNLVITAFFTNLKDYQIQNTWQYDVKSSWYFLEQKIHKIHRIILTYLIKTIFIYLILE